MARSFSETWICVDSLIFSSKNCTHCIMMLNCNVMVLTSTEGMRPVIKVP